MTSRHQTIPCEVERPLNGRSSIAVYDLCSDAILRLRRHLAIKQLAEEVIVLMRKTSRKYCCPRFGCNYRPQNRRARRTEGRVLREPDDDRHAFRHQGPSCHLYHSTARFFAPPRACSVCSLTDFRAFSDHPRSSAAVSYVLSDIHPTHLTTGAAQTGSPGSHTSDRQDQQTAILV